MSTKKAAPDQPGEGSSLSVQEGVPAYALKKVRQGNPERQLFMREFGRRCKEARGAIEVVDAAALIGVHRNTIWNIERGDSLPDAFELELMARIYGTTPAWLVQGGAGDGFCVGIQKSLRAVESGGFIYVPLFEVQASAGNGTFNDLEAVLKMRPFDLEYIRAELRIAHSDLALIGVVGDSMEPELHSKDTVLLDLRDRDVLTEGTHVIRLDGALMVKRVQRLPGKVLRVSSRNPAYDPFEIKGQEDGDRDFEVLGRVRWGGVTFT